MNLAANARKKNEGVFKMKSVFKSVVAIMLAAALLLAFTACNKGGESKQKEGNETNAPTSAPVNPPRTATPTLSPDIAAVTYTIDATAAYASGMLPADIMGKLSNNGLLVKKAGVTLPKNSAVSTPFEMFNNVYNIDYKFDPANGVSFQGITNGSCGENSRWVLKINDNEVTGSFDNVTVNNGDEVLWIFVIN